MATVADMLAELVADRRAAEAALGEARSEGEAQRERAARAEGEVAGLRESLRVAEEGRREADARAVGVQATADRERVRAVEEARRAAEAELRAVDAIRRAEAAEEAGRAFLAAPWWRRMLGRS